MKIFLVVVMVVWSCHATVIYDIDNAESLFEDFIKEFSKEYRNKHVKQMRFNIFKDNLVSINEKNQEQDSAEFEINMFTDLTTGEFTAQFTGLRESLSGYYCKTEKQDKDIPDAHAPSSWDWRSKDVINPIRNQDNCKADWAFSAIATLESAYAIKHNELLSLSEQYVVDCTRYGSGCIVGSIDATFRFLKDNGGAKLEKDYPYVGFTDCCNINVNKGVVNVKSCTTYNLTSSDKAKQLLFAEGPYSIAVQGTALQHYKRGIISAKTCNQGPITHAVNLVGYGSEDGKDYWIVRNSWGDCFGEDGYFRMERGEGKNTCNFLNPDMANAEIE